MNNYLEQKTQLIKKDDKNLIPSNVIRIETVLSKLPIHNLAKKGNIEININRKNKKGETKLLWEVSANKKYGEPRQLAYRLDTLIINHRLDKLGKPFPEIIMIGSLRSIARELGLKENDTDRIKKSLYQNATTTITAKLEYKANDGSIQSLDAVFSRYTLLILGQQLPDGKKADAVYLILNRYYREVLNNSPTRPIDYDYLKKLSSSPSAQRFYEYLSYRVYAALKNNSPYARIRYSEYCTFAPQVRQYNKKRMQQQMSKIHRPHIEDNYIEKKVNYRETTDDDGNLDWSLTYTINRRAKAQFKTFSKKQKSREPQLSLTPLLEQTAPSTRAGELVKELAQLGVTESVAEDLVHNSAESAIRLWIEAIHYIKAEDKAAAIVSAIKGNWQPPSSYFKAKAEKEKEEQATIETERKLEEQRQQEQQLKEHHTKLEALYRSLSEDQQKDIENQARERTRNESDFMRQQIETKGEDSLIVEQTIQRYRYTILEELQQQNQGIGK